MSINRYQCFTGYESTNYDATITEDGPWVSYQDHAKEIATLRAQVTRRDEEISDLRHEIESARDAAKGENALRLEAERERDEARAAFRVLDAWSVVFSFTPASIRAAIEYQRIPSRAGEVTRTEERAAIRAEVERLKLREQELLDMDESFERELERGEARGWVVDANTKEERDQ